MPTADIRAWSKDQLPVREGRHVVGIIQRQPMAGCPAPYLKYSYTSLRNGRTIYEGPSFGAAVDAFQYQRLRDRGL
jgi:hypothetical protein